MYGDLLTITIKIMPDGFEARAKCEMSPLAGWQFCAFSETDILDATKKLYAIIQEHATRELVNIHINKLLENSK